MMTEPNKDCCPVPGQAGSMVLNSLCCHLTNDIMKIPDSVSLFNCSCRSPIKDRVCWNDFL